MLQSGYLKSNMSRFDTPICEKFVESQLSKYEIKVSGIILMSPFIDFGQI